MGLDGSMGSMGWVCMGLDGFDGMGWGWDGRCIELPYAGVLALPLSPSSLLNAAASYVHSRGKQLHIEPPHPIPLTTRASPSPLGISIQ